LISDGCFHESGMLTVAAAIDTHALEQLFRHSSSGSGYAAALNSETSC
jgi:hypothetical protein